MYIYWAGWGLAAMYAYSFWRAHWGRSSMSNVVPQIVVTREDHQYCARTGFCKRCGVHKEMVEYESLLCRYATNMVVISHLRAEKILDAKLNKVMDEFSKEKPTV